MSRHAFAALGLVLGSALASSTVSAAPAAPVAPACPRAGAPVVERFIGADCPECWAARPDAAAPAGAWVFDWIVPTPQGDEAALSAAASGEALERAQRFGGPPPPAGERSAPPQPLPRTKLRLRMVSGPAWNGYFGLQIELRGPLPPGSSAWMALVEKIPAGSEGSAIERSLMRTVVGPLPVEGAAGAQGTKHLRALRWPSGADPTRFEARGWVEDRDGRLLAVTEARCGSRIGRR
ncbi:hypothetical protein [Aquabacterium sp.]|uniref:hypothetical protein n=1 Tax=Aquabacterium sp. TaxID=1872578 RepID=UPI0037837291